MSRRDRWLIALVFLSFTMLGIARHLHNYGEDLASSYIGCRLLATGQSDHLYRHSSVDFREVNDSVWDEMAVKTGFGPLRLLHPYVQTPLWAYSLEPACMHLNFRSFCDAYIVLFMLCVSATIWIVARFWTPDLLHPTWMAAICAGLYVSEPFKYAIFLAQTHILYLFLTVLALVLAQRRWPITGGLLLALAAAVKITPALLVLYWLLTRRYRAALSFLGASVVLIVLTVLLLGTGLTRDYLHSLSENANVLLLAFNNQSFAGWWGGLWGPAWELRNWVMHPLSPALRLVSATLTIASALWGAFLDREAKGNEAERPPYGAVLSLVGATVFAPIAWTHYFILLVIPVMFILSAWRQNKAAWLILCALLILLLNLYPLSSGAVHLYLRPYTVVRSQFYAGLLAMGALTLLALRRPRHALPWM